MLPTICLDDQPLLLANEVDDERPDRLLTTKLGALNLSASKGGPKRSFGICHVAAQALCPRESLASVTRHALTLPPLCGSLPLPRGERGLRAACRLRRARRRGTR